MVLLPVTLPASPQAVINRVRTSVCGGEDVHQFAMSDTAPGGVLLAALAVPLDFAAGLGTVEDFPAEGRLVFAFEDDPAGAPQHATAGVLEGVAHQKSLVFSFTMRRAPFLSNSVSAVRPTIPSGLFFAAIKHGFKASTNFFCRIFQRHVPDERNCI
jgi:hypothetical protein